MHWVNEKQNCYENNDYIDAYGNGCETYSANPQFCGTFDLEGSTSMTACCACLRDRRTIPVVRLKPIQDESGVVMCSYLPDYSSKHIYFLHSTIQKSFKSLDWYECLSVYSNETASATFLLKSQSNYIKSMT